MKQITITPSKDFWSVPSLRGFPDVQFEDLIVETPLPKPFFDSMRAMAAGKSGNVLLNTYQHHYSNGQQGNLHQPVPARRSS